jgi:hypothetical protein
VSTRLQFVTAGAGTIAACGLCLVLAGPASAATGSPSTPPSPLPTSTDSAFPLAVTATPSAPAVAPTAPIQVPAGNAGTTHDSSGASTTEISLLAAGGIVLAAGGTVLARRHG